MPQRSMMQTIIGHCELIEVNNWFCDSATHCFVFTINEHPCDANARITVTFSMLSRASIASEKMGKAKSTLLLLTKSTNSSVFLTNVACKLHGNCSPGPVPKHAVFINQTIRSYINPLSEIFVLFITYGGKSSRARVKVHFCTLESGSCNSRAFRFVRMSRACLISLDWCNLLSLLLLMTALSSYASRKQMTNPAAIECIAVKASFLRYW